MVYIAYIAFFFVSMQLVNSLLNLVFIQKIPETSAAASEKISVLIPARNEAENLEKILSDLKKIENKNLEILVFDDNSTDQTAQVVKKHTTKDERIKLIASIALPKGWLGKNHACYQLAQQAKGNYYLFVDADVRLKNNIINESVAYQKAKNIGLLSIFPKQIVETTGEKISVPLMNYILLSLLPLVFVRKSPFKSHTAANGQFMLFSAAVYKQYKPHQQFKTAVVEDIAIARFLKKQNEITACITGTQNVQCRMYKSYQEALNGFSKNVFMFFGNQAFLAFIFWLFAAFGFVPVLWALPNFLPLYIAAVLFTLIFYSKVSMQNTIATIVFFPLHLLFLIQLIIKGLFITKNITWKGRKIYS